MVVVVDGGVVAVVDDVLSILDNMFRLYFSENSQGYLEK